MTVNKEFNKNNEINNSLIPKEILLNHVFDNFIKNEQFDNIELYEINNKWFFNKIENNIFLN